MEMNVRASKFSPQVSAYPHWPFWLFQPMGSFLFNTLVLALFPATKNVFRKHKHHEKWTGFTDKCCYYLAKEIANIMSKKMGSFYLPGSCYTVLMGNFFDI